MSFIDSLRMNGIFRPEGGGGNLLGPPDMNGGGINVGDVISQIMQARETGKMNDENRQYRMLNFQNDMNKRNNAPKPPSALESIAGGMSGKPMNTVVQYPDDDRRNSMRMTDYQRAMVENDKAKLAQSAQLAGLKDQNQDADRMIRQQRADTYSNMHDLSDAEKLEIINRARRGDIEARGMIEAGLLETRGRQAMDRQNDQQMFDAGMAGVNQQNALARIAAEVAGRNNNADYKSGLSDVANPNFDRTANWNKAQQIINTRPELAPFITLGEGGQFNIQAPGTNFWGSATGPTKDQYDELNRIIYGNPAPLPTPPKKPTSTTLPANKNTDTTVKPTSKYKVTIE